MVIDEVPAWDPSVRSSKRLTVTPKRHLGDPSLAAALLRMSPTRMLDDLETTGVLFESLVAHDLRVSADAARAWTFHYRDAEGRLEVDYIIENREGDWVGIEVKLGRIEIDKAADSLLTLADRVARKPKALVVITGTSFAHTRARAVGTLTQGRTPCCPARSAPVPPRCSQQVGLIRYIEVMVSTEFLASVAALSVDDRLELVGYIESTLDGGAVPTPEQHEVVARRDAELRADPDLGLTKDEAIAAIRALRA